MTAPTLNEAEFRVLIVYASPDDPRIQMSWYPLSARAIDRFLRLGWLRKTGRVTQEITDEGRMALAALNETEGRP